MDGAVTSRPCLICDRTIPILRNLLSEVKDSDPAWPDYLWDIKTLQEAIEAAHNLLEEIDHETQRMP